MPDAFDRALRAAARRGGTQGVCPDAEALAAYADGRLSAGERTAIEAHAADCAACVQHLALLATASTEIGARAPSRSWTMRWGWLVPIATTVLVVAVWTRLPDQPAAPVPVPAREETIGRAERESAARGGPQQPGPLLDRQVPATESGTASDAPAAELSRQRPGGRQELRDHSAPRGFAQKAAPAEAASERADVPAKPAPPSSAPSSAEPPTPATGAARAQAAAPAPPPPAAPTRDTFSSILPDANRREARQRGSDELSADAAAPTIVTGWARDWYRASGGRIEVSPDAGVTWRDAFADRGVTFTAAACAEGGSCWFGTSEGQVLRNEPDGFARSALPTRARVVAVAPGPNGEVFVTVEGGVRFRSTDGGRTWHPDGQ